MIYVFAAFVLIASVCVMLDLREDRKSRKQAEHRIDIADQERGELMKRVNILDEVVTQHSEELDELQRMTTIRGIVRELEAKSGETVEIQ